MQSATEWHEKSSKSRRNADYKVKVDMFAAGIHGEHDREPDETRRKALYALGIALAAAGNSDEDHTMLANTSVYLSAQLYAAANGIVGLPEAEQTATFRAKMLSKTTNLTKIYEGRGFTVIPDGWRNTIH